MVSCGSGRVGFRSKGLPGAARASVKVMSATKNIVGMISRSRRMTYLSTGLRPSVSRNTEGAGVLPAPSRRRSDGALGLLRHVDAGPVIELEAKRCDRVILHVRLLQELDHVVVDPCHRRILRQLLAGLQVHVVTFLQVGLFVRPIGQV